MTRTGLFWIPWENGVLLHHVHCDCSRERTNNGVLVDCSLVRNSSNGKLHVMPEINHSWQQLQHYLLLSTELVSCTLSKGKLFIATCLYILLSAPKGRVSCVSKEVRNLQWFFLDYVKNCSATSWNPSTKLTSTIFFYWLVKKPGNPKLWWGMCLFLDNNEAFWVVAKIQW